MGRDKAIGEQVQREAEEGPAPVDPDDGPAQGHAEAPADPNDATDEGRHAPPH